MKTATSRVRQARRHANLSQAQLAAKVGVHRSAVAQWEHAGGCHPTVENMARIASTTGVAFEWLATGRGRMTYVSDILPGEETPALLLEYSAQSETEVRALLALRHLEVPSALAIVEMMSALAKTQRLKLKRRRRAAAR
jgi:transcriptional regulator with XRE-family HTH domain